MDKNIEKLRSVHLHRTSPLKIFVWRVRRFLRNVLHVDLFDTNGKAMPGRQKLRSWYLKIDDALLKHLPKIARDTPRDVAMKRIRDTLELELGYEFGEIDVKRPWGGFFRIVDSQTDKFLKDFFPGLTQTEARLGKKDIELSPKIMVWLPGQRISWQYHDRRAERWHFLTAGSYYRSNKDELPEPIQAKPGDIVQFDRWERHRGAASQDSYTLVAEIWQHTDGSWPSDESDITRLADDYQRPKH